MRRLALTLLFAGGTAAAQVPAPVIGSQESEISSLARNLDNVVKLCGELAIRAAVGDTAYGRVETASVASGVLKFVANPPPGLAAAANPKYGAARFGQWFDPHAAIWIIGYEKTPVCRALVTHSKWAAKVVPELEKLVRVGDFWKPQASADPLPPGLVRSVFVAESARRDGVVPWLTITSLPSAEATGKVQLTLSVSLVRETEK
ncbi:MAG TPA: hypothetical protein VE053_09985 [Allosphingosinicella sp.]|nr:hypothetical protein [Allosphingosinicella sp.]